MSPSPGEVHEDVDRLVADREAADLLEAERLVERDRAVDVGDAVAGVDQVRHVRSFNKKFNVDAP